MEQSDVLFATVKAWRNESLEISDQSNDALLGLISKSFETIYAVLSQDSDDNRVNRSIASLNFERIQALDCEKKEFDSLRHLVFGLVESIQLVLSQVKGFERDGQEKPLSRENTIVKEEPVDVSDAFELADLESVGTNPPSAKNDMSAGDMSEGESFNDESAGEGNDCHGVEEEGDEAQLDDETQENHERASGLRGRKHDLQCPECEFHTTNVTSFMNHLRFKHNTTPSLSGFALLCECGKESLSEMHGKSCDISNFTIVRKRDGPIRRMNDEEVRVTPQCFLCEAYPTTMGGYGSHLQRKHQTSLQRSGFFLKCDCGLIERVTNVNPKHTKKCIGRPFTLHEDEESRIIGKGEKNLTEKEEVVETPKIPIATPSSKPRVSIGTFFTRGTIKKDQTVGKRKKELTIEEFVENKDEPKETPMSSSKTGMKRRRSRRLVENSECMDDSDEAMEPPKKKVQ